MSSSIKRFAKYPALAEMLREMSPEGRRLIQQWNIVVNSGFDGFMERTIRELRRKGYEFNEVETAREVLGIWQRTMIEVAAIVADPRPADWCCARGMHAWPSSCPQHPPKGLL